MGAYGGSGGRYIVDMVWTSHGGQVLATMGQIQSGMRGVGTSAGTSERQLAGWNRQLSAIQTTLRYFVAGGLVYGAVNAFRSYAQFQSQLGDIAAISPEFNQNQISQLGNTLLMQSSQLATQVGELEDSARNIQSTMQGLNPQQITMFTDLFSKGAKVAETDAYNFGNSVMGMRNAFKISLNDMGGVANEFFGVIQKSAGMTGDEWAKFSGRVVAGAVQANLKLEEMNALMVLMTRSGGTAATNARHLSQLFMRLRTPTQEAEPLWAAIGLGPQQRARMGGMEILRRIMDEIRRRGGVRAGRATEDQLSMMEELGATGQLTPGQAMISGPAAQWLAQLTGRMESLRAISVLYSNFPGDPKNNLESFNQLLQDFEQMKTSTNELDAGFQRWLDRNRIQQAGTALHNMLIRTLNPMEGVISNISGHIANWASSDAAPKIAGGAAIAGGAYALLRILRGTGRGLLPFLRGGGAGTLALAQGGAPPTGSFANPFWVMIHPLSGGGGIGGFSKTPAGGGPTPVPTAGRRVPGVLGWLGRGGAMTAMAMIAGNGLASGAGESERRAFRGSILDMIQGNPKIFPYLSRSLPFLKSGGLGPYEAGLWQRIMGGQLRPGAAEAQLRHMNLSGQLDPKTGSVKISLEASQELLRMLHIRVDATDGRKRVHVPVGHSAWQGGASPSFRGDQRVYRGGL